MPRRQTPQAFAIDPGKGGCDEVPASVNFLRHRGAPGREKGRYIAGMNLLFITDLHHRRERLADLPPADLLVIGGDISHFGRVADVAALLALLQQKYPAVLGVLGNCDPPAAEAVFTQAGINLHLQTRDWGGGLFCGVAGSNPTPSNTPNEWREDDMAIRLQTLAGSLAGLSPAPAFKVLVSHAPPHGSGAGRLPNGLDAGSRTVAAFARNWRPDLVLCGHIHEAMGLFSLDDMPVINPGPLRDGHYATIAWEPPQPPQIRLF